MSLAESAVDSIHTALDVGLKTVTDARDLEQVKSYVFGEKDLDAIDDTPMIYIFGDNTVIDRWVPEPNGLWDATHEMTIGIVVESLDTEEIRRNLYKYTRAMLEVIIDSYPTDEFFPRGRIRVEYSPVLSRQSRFLGDAFIRLSLQKVESR